MTQNFTPNDLIKNLYEPESGFSESCVDAIIAYSKRNIAIQS